MIQSERRNQKGVQNNLIGHSDFVNKVLLRTDLNKIYSSSYDKTIIIWDL